MSAPKNRRRNKDHVDDNLPIFDIDDTFHMMTPHSAPFYPSSMEPEPSTSHQDWHVCIARRGLVSSRSPTPDVDLHHPRPPRITELLDAKLGFFLSDKIYISHWECCKCSTTQPITDKNSRWRSRRATILTLAGKDDNFYAEKCPRLECAGVRCDTCFDVDLVGYRRQYCNKAPCELKKTPLWLKGVVEDFNLHLPYDERSAGSIKGEFEQEMEDFAELPKKFFPARP